MLVFPLGCAAPVEEQRARVLKEVTPHLAVSEYARIAMQNQTRCRYREIPQEKMHTADSLLAMAGHQHDAGQLDLAIHTYDRASLHYQLLMSEATLDARDNHIRRLESLLVSQTEKRQEHERLVQKIKVYEEVISKLEGTWKR